MDTHNPKKRLCSSVKSVSELVRTANAAEPHGPRNCSSHSKAQRAHGLVPQPERSCKRRALTTYPMRPRRFSIVRRSSPDGMPKMAPFGLDDPSRRLYGRFLILWGQETPDCLEHLIGIHRLADPR